VKVLNLEKVSRIKRNNLIVEYCGGQYTKREAVNVGGVGVGGLKYIDGAEQVDTIKRRAYLRSNIETLKNGLAFYLRDDEGNYMLLIHSSEILNIMLMEDEIIDLKPAKLKVITTHLDEINFECARRNPMKIEQFFSNSPFADKFNIDYSTYKYI